MNRPDRLLLLLLLFATSVCIVATHERPTAMTSNYLQQTYEIPFNGLVPPPGLGNSMDDDFQARSPQKEQSGTPLPGYVELGSKWKTFDPDAEMTFVGVDARLQMLLLTGSPEKAWCGVYQDMPPELLPSTIGQTKQLAFYLRSTLAFVEANLEFYDNIKYGLMLGQDLTGAPTTSPIIAAHAQLIKVPDPDDTVPSASGIVQATVFPNFEALGTPGGRVNGWPASSYVRIRLLQRMNGVGDFSLQYSVDASAYGQDWITLVDADEVTGQPAPFKSVGIGLNGNAYNFGAYFDAFRVIEQSIGDQTRTIGGTQQLGAV